MKTAFMVAEKPSLAASLANILSNGHCSSRKGRLMKNLFDRTYDFKNQLIFIKIYYFRNEWIMLST